MVDGVATVYDVECVEFAMLHVFTHVCLVPELIFGGDGEGGIRFSDSKSFACRVHASKLVYLRDVSVRKGEQL